MLNRGPRLNQGFSDTYTLQLSHAYILRSNATNHVQFHLAFQTRYMAKVNTKQQDKRFENKCHLYEAACLIRGLYFVEKIQLIIYTGFSQTKLTTITPFQ